MICVTCPGFFLVVTDLDMTVGFTVCFVVHEAKSKTFDDGFLLPELF